VRGMLTGFSVPWNLAASLALGVWVMIVPYALGVEAMAANAHFIIGALICITAIMAMAEVTRLARYGNIGFALLIAIAAIILEGGNPAGMANGLLVAVALIGLSLPRGRIRERHGEWERRWIR
jgi:hypothetical protein